MCADVSTHVVVEDLAAGGYEVLACGLPESSVHFALFFAEWRLLEDFQSLGVLFLGQKLRKSSGEIVLRLITQIKFFACIQVFDLIDFIRRRSASRTGEWLGVFRCKLVNEGLGADASRSSECGDGLG